MTDRSLDINNMSYSTLNDDIESEENQIDYMNMDESRRDILNE